MTDNSPTIEELESIADTGDMSVADMLREEFDQAKPAEKPLPEPDVPEEELAEEPKGASEGEPEDPPKDEPKAEEPKAEEIEPPADWSAEEHEKFRKLDTDARKWVLDRVTTAEKAEKDAQDASKKYSALEDAISGHRDQWARDGMSEPVAIKQLIALSDYAANKPEEFIHWFASQRGIQLGQQQEPKEEQEQEFLDPEVNALRSEIHALKSELGQIKGTTEQLSGSLTERQKQEQEADYKRTESLVEEFRSQKDDDGNIVHPYFEQVKAEMGMYMKNGLVNDLQGAYDRACRANPDVSAKIEQARKAREVQEQAKKDREKAAAARKTGSSVSGSPGARSESSMTGDLRNDLRSEFATRGLV